MSDIYLEPTGLIRRFLAFLVDGFAMLGIALLLLTPCTLYVFTVSLNKDFENLLHDPVLIVASIALFLLQPLYFVYFPSSFRQATLGQRFMNMYVVRLNQAKVRAGFAFARFLVWFLPPAIIDAIFTSIAINFLDKSILEGISFIFFVAWYLIPPMLSDKNQGIHDMLLKTVVVDGKLAKTN